MSQQRISEVLDPSPMAPNSLLVDAATVAKLLSISESTLFKLKGVGCLPAPVTFGRSVRWNAEELRAWVNADCPSQERWNALRHRLGVGADRTK